MDEKDDEIAHCIMALSLRARQYSHKRKLIIAQKILEGNLAMQELHHEINVTNKLEPTRFTTPETEKNFRIHSSLDILFILRGIMQANLLVTLYPDVNDNFILTSILAIDPEHNQIIIDYGSNEKTCEKALKYNELNFVTIQNRVKIEFTCNQIQKMVDADIQAGRKVLIGHGMMYLLKAG